MKHGKTECGWCSSAKIHPLQIKEVTSIARTKWREFEGLQEFYLEYYQRLPKIHCLQIFVCFSKPSKYRSDLQPDVPFSEVKVLLGYTWLHSWRCLLVLVLNFKLELEKDKGFFSSSLLRWWRRDVSFSPRCMQSREPMYASCLQSALSLAGRIFMF